MKTLNYRHSLETMRGEIKSRTEGKEEIMFFAQAGKHVFNIIEKYDDFADAKRTCGVFYNETDLAEYINSL